MGVWWGPGSPSVIEPLRRLVCQQKGSGDGRCLGRPSRSGLTRWTVSEEEKLNGRRKFGWYRAQEAGSLD